MKTFKGKNNGKENDYVACSSNYYIYIRGYLKQRNRLKEDIVILEKESYLSDFIVEGDMVQISCVISFENRSNVDRTIKVKGDFKNEIDTALLKESCKVFSQMKIQMKLL